MAEDVVCVRDEILGTVHDEHHDPNERRWSSIALRAMRTEYTDRPFYTLTMHGPGTSGGADLDTAGWQQLRDLCDVVLGRIEQEASHE